MTEEELIKKFEDDIRELKNPTPPPPPEEPSRWGFTRDNPAPGIDLYERTTHINTDGMLHDTVNDVASYINATDPMLQVEEAIRNNPTVMDYITQEVRRRLEENTEDMLEDPDPDDYYRREESTSYDDEGYDPEVEKLVGDDD